MQPYKNHVPIGDPELTPDNAEEFQKRIGELFDSGADEIKIFRPTKEQRRQWRKK